MTTVNNLITRAMRSLKALGDNEVPSASEYEDGRVAFNSLLESLSLENLYSYVVQETNFAVSIGTSSYTVGTSGTVVVNRPTQITQAYFVDGNSNNYFINLHTRETWNNLGSKTLNSQIPTDMFYDPQYPLGVISIYPTPAAAGTVYFDATLQQSTFPSGTTQLNMPIGYERMYVFGLAVELANMFGYDIPPVGPGQKNVAVLAMEAMSAVKRNNIQIPTSYIDQAIVGRSQYYNVFTDT